MDDRDRDSRIRPPTLEGPEFNLDDSSPARGAAPDRPAPAAPPPLPPAPEPRPDPPVAPPRRPPPDPIRPARAQRRGHPIEEGRAQPEIEPNTTSEYDWEPFDAEGLPRLPDHLAVFVAQAKQLNGYWVLAHPTVIRVGLQFVGVVLFVPLVLLSGPGFDAANNVLEKIGPWPALPAIFPLLLQFGAAIYPSGLIWKEILDRFASLFLAGIASLCLLVHFFTCPNPIALTIASISLWMVTVPLFTRRASMDRAWLLRRWPYWKGAGLAAGLAIVLPLAAAVLFVIGSVVCTHRVEAYLAAAEDSAGRGCRVLDGTTHRPSRLVLLLGSGGFDGDLGHALAECAVRAIDSPGPRALALRPTAASGALDGSEANTKIIAPWTTFSEQFQAEFDPVLGWSSPTERRHYESVLSAAAAARTEWCGDPTRTLEAGLLWAASEGALEGTCLADLLDPRREQAVATVLRWLEPLGSAAFFRADLADPGGRGIDTRLQGLLLSLTPAGYAPTGVEQQRRLAFVQPAPDGSLRRTVDLLVVPKAQIEADRRSRLLVAGQTGNEVRMALYGSAVNRTWIREQLEAVWAPGDTWVLGDADCEGDGRHDGDLVFALDGEGHVVVAFGESGTAEDGAGFQWIRIAFDEESPCAAERW